MAGTEDQKAKDEKTERDRVAAIEQQSRDAAAARDAEKARADAAEGELERVRAELEAQRKANAVLQSANSTLATNAAAGGLPPLPCELPKGAHRLLESVTFMGIGADGKPTRRAGLAGAVVLVEPKGVQLERLQRELGQSAVAFAIAGETETELRQAGFIR
jgi:hypothetical protein